MNKTDFCAELRERLYGLPEETIASTVSYYGEMIDERIEDGMTEEEAVAAIGTPACIAEQVRAEYAAPVKEPPQKKKSYAWVIVLIIIIGLPLIAFCAAFIASGFNMSESVETVTNTYAVEDAFRNIQIGSYTGEVKICASEDGKVNVECRENEKLHYDISVRNDVLEIKQKDERKWFDFLSFFMMLDNGMTLYLPAGEYDALNLSSTSGLVDIPEGFSFSDVNVAVTSGSTLFFADVRGNLNIASTSGGMNVQSTVGQNANITNTSGRIHIESMNVQGDISIHQTSGSIGIEDTICSALKLKSISGAIEMTALRCAEIDMKSTSGKIDMNDVIATGTINIESTSGGVNLERCDGGEIYIDVVSGKVKATLLSGKTFTATSTSGRVSIPKTTPGAGMCEVHSVSGSIEIDVVD